MNKSEGKSHLDSEQNRNNRTTQSPIADAEEVARACSARISKIRELNDTLRVQGRGGMVVMTNGVAALGLGTVNAIFAAITSFSRFDADNDPWGEHDCAALEVYGHRLIWKIDYYDRTQTYHSPEPADPKVTVRVMTVMLADEY